MIRKLKSGQAWLYSKKLDPRTGKRRNLGTFDTHAGAEQHEREVQYFKHHCWEAATSVRRPRRKRVVENPVHFKT